MTSTVYRIRNKKTGQFFSGGSTGGWTNGTGATYEKAAAFKCVWSMRRRYQMTWQTGWGDPAEIVEYTVTEVPGKTGDMP